MAFCEKEQQELTKRFKEIEEQLTKEQSSALDVKLEDSEKSPPLICAGDNSDDDVVFILPEDYSPLKRRKLDDDKKAEKTVENVEKKDVSITYFRPATNLPHARENCSIHKFVQSNVTSSTVSCNEKYCEQCYCYVCDARVQECDTWKTGTNPHCNGYAKNSFWEKLRKMGKRKMNAVQDSLLKCLPADEQTESLKAAAEQVTGLLETLRSELNDSSNNFNSRPSSSRCDCDCHYDSDDSYDRYEGEGCWACYDEHESRCAFDDWPLFGRYGRWNFSISSNVSSTVSKANDFLKSNQPGQAAVVLDALTVLLLAADNERNYWPSGEISSVLRSVRKAWIEVLMHPDLPKNVEEKVRERLKTAIDGALICSPESTGLKVILEMKKWNDEAMVKCLSGKLGDECITEDEEVVEARIAFFEKRKRFSDALSYMMSCKMKSRSSFGYYNSIYSSANGQKLANISNYRYKFILFLVKTGKIDQALNVITMPPSAVLPNDVLNTTSKASIGSVNNPQIALRSMSFLTMKEIIIAMINDANSAEPGKLPSPQVISEEKLRRVLVLLLTGAQVNPALRGETAMEWSINSLCESSLSNNLSKDVRQKFVKEAEQIVSKAKGSLLDPLEIKPPFKGPFKVFVVDLFAALAASISGMTNIHYQANLTQSVLQTFKRKNLNWACVSLVLSPNLADKTTHSMLSFVLENLIKPLGSSCIPLEVYRRWIKKVPDVHGIDKNFEIALCMYKEGKKQKASNLSTDAVSLVKDIIGIMDAFLDVNKSQYSGKDTLATVIKKIRKEFGFAIKDDEWKLTTFTFKNQPTYENFESVRSSCKKEKWPQLRTSLLDFLKKRRASHTVYCIDVFARCFMFTEVKLALNASGFPSNYPNICEKIKQTLSKLQKDEGCRLAEVCSDWLGQTLCKAAFGRWRHSNYSYIPESMLSCLKAIADVKMDAFTKILSTAIVEVAKVFSNNTVQAKHRSDLERWLKDIKNLYSSKRQLTEWSWAFHFLTTGHLKRKPAVIRQLKNSNSLMAGTVPHHQLLKIQAANTPTANNPSDKPAQQHTAARTQSGYKVVSTPSNTYNGKQGSAVRTESLNTAFVASPKKSSSAKPAQVVNIAGSTPCNTSYGKSPQANGNATSKQGNTAVSTPTTNVNGKAVNMARSTPNTSNGKCAAGGKAISKQGNTVSTPISNTNAKTVNMAGTTPNTSNGRSAQVNPAHTSVNMAASTRRNVPVAQLSGVNPVRSSTARIASPTGTNPGNKVQTPTVLLQVGNTTMRTANPNAMPQQVIRLSPNFLANLTGNNTVQNVVISRMPVPHGANVSTTPGSVRNTAPSPRPITTIASSASSTSGSVQTASTAVASSSSAAASAKTSKGSRA